MRRLCTMVDRLKGCGMLLIVAATCVVLPGSLASAQTCNSQGFSTDRSSPGTVRSEATTTATPVPNPGGNCSGRLTRAEAWIDGRVWECADDPTPAGNCWDEDSGGNAVVSASDNDACGSWTGRGSHKYTEGGNANLMANSSATLNAGVCTDPCDYYDWSESECRANEPSCNWESSNCFTPPPSPIIIDTGKNAKYELTSAADGVMFDIDGDGNVEKISWTPPNSSVAFLALDVNDDGQITSGKELFGNFTVPGSPNGFDALQKLAMQTNGGEKRGSVSEDDPLFARLLLWTDKNHNGISEPSELRPAREVVSEIGLGYQVRKQTDEHGNRFTFRGWVHIRTKPGRNKVDSAAENNERTRHIWDVYLKRFF